jgi:hypothetical protein
MCVEFPLSLRNVEGLLHERGIDGSYETARFAATAWVNNSSFRHRATNCRQAARIAGPLYFLKSAMVLKSGARRWVSHIISTLRWALVSL